MSTPQEVLRNRDVIALLAAGVSAEVIIAKIAASNAAFDVTTRGLIELSDAKVPSTIVKAMVERAGATPEPPSVDPRRRHSGFWGSIGGGAGSLGCDECYSTVSGITSQLSMGWTIRSHVRVGLGINGWFKSENGESLSAGSLAATVRVYPSATGGFYVNAGLGVASAKLSVYGVGAESLSGSSALLGLGYDIRLTRSMSVTPYVNGVGLAFDGITGNFSQIGLAFTFH